MLTCGRQPMCPRRCKMIRVIFRRHTPDRTGHNAIGTPTSNLHVDGAAAVAKITRRARVSGARRASVAGRATRCLWPAKFQPGRGLRLPFGRAPGSPSRRCSLLRALSGSIRPTGVFDKTTLPRGTERNGKWGSLRETAVDALALGLTCQRGQRRRIACGRQGARHWLCEPWLSAP
jgi:hypothetical protein